MGTLPKQRHDDRSGATRSEPEGTVSRRAMLAGTVAATAAAAVVPIAGAAYAAGPDVSSSQDMMAFLLLSAALAGVHVATSGAGVQPDVNKDDYWIRIPASTRSMSRTTTSGGSTPTTRRRHSANCFRLPRTIVKSADRHHRCGERRRRRYQIPGPQHRPALVSRLVVRAGGSEKQRRHARNPRASTPRWSSRRRHTLRDWFGRSREPIRWATAICSSVIGRAIRTIRTIQ